jgi:predicted transglutaminase-like cysteine proteinase
MTVGIYKSTLAAVFLGASLHAADATQIHLPMPPEHPATDAGPQAARHVVRSSLPISGYLDFEQRAPIPEGQYKFCKRSPVDCFNNLTPLRVHLTKRVLDVIAAINQQVNSDILPATDQQQYGVEEYWTYPKSGQGDCEDYQLLKQKMLRDAGFPQSTLRHAVVLDTNGAGHDVLVIHTDRGDFAIDNLSDDVRTLGETGYSFQKILSASSDYEWKTFVGKDWRAFYTAAGVGQEPVYIMDPRTLALVERRLDAEGATATTGAIPQPKPRLN